MVVGGGADYRGTSKVDSNGGIGGGGLGEEDNLTAGGDGTANTGGGGGGSGINANGGAGGSGIVILRYQT